VCELRRIEGRDGSEPGHLRRTRGLFWANSMDWNSRPMDLAWEIRKSADCWYRGEGCAVLI